MFLLNDLHIGAFLSNVQSCYHDFEQTRKALFNFLHYSRSGLSVRAEAGNFPRLLQF